MIGRLFLGGYLLVTCLPDAVARWILERRLARGKEDPERLGERLGFTDRARPDGSLIWLHGASVGEALSMLPLIEALGPARPEARFLVTTGTVTSARRMATLLPERAVHQFVPIDAKGAVGRFLDHWRPDLAIWVESEFWPRLMVETSRRSVPMALVNARVSARSARGWARAGDMLARILRPFRLIAAQDGETVERLSALGAAPAVMSERGNLKVAIAPPDADPEALASARAALGARPVWAAVSTHAPEEEAVLAAHQAAAEALPGLLTILVPRHPERGDALAEQIRAAGLGLARRSLGELPGPKTQIWLADSLGEMGLWLRLAPVAFVGGSIAPKGGHNPFEPAALGAAILHGPSVENFRPAYAALRAAEAVRETRTAAEMGAALADLLPEAGGPRRAAMVAAAREVREAAMPDVPVLASALLSLIPHRGAG